MKYYVERKFVSAHIRMNSPCGGNFWYHGTLGCCGKRAGFNFLIKHKINSYLLKRWDLLTYFQFRYYIHVFNSPVDPTIHSSVHLLIHLFIVCERACVSAFLFNACRRQKSALKVVTTWLGLWIPWLIECSKSYPTKCFLFCNEWWLIMKTTLICDHTDWCFLRGCIQKFSDWVDNEIYTCKNRHSFGSNTKAYGGKTH
jgi:hypothetical protein